MPSFDTVYRYRDLIELHLYSTDVMTNRSFEYLWAFRVEPVHANANIIDIITELEDNLEFKLYLERITACTIAGYHMNVFIKDNTSYFVIGIMTKHVTILDEDPPYGYFKLAQFPMSSVLNSKYGHLTSLNTIDGRYHLFNVNGMRSTMSINLNACKDIAVQCYSAIFPMKNMDSLKNRIDEYNTKYNYHKMYEPDMDVDEINNVIRDPYPEDITEFLVPIYEEVSSAAIEALGVCFAPGITNVDMGLLNFNTCHRYINRNSYIYECLLWGYDEYKIGKLSPWVFVGESALMQDNYERVILNMITAVYSSIYDIIVPYKLEIGHTFGEQDTETGKLRKMIEMEVVSIKYHLGLSMDMLPVKSSTNAPRNEYDQSYNIYADCVQIVNDDSIFVYNVVRTYERGEGNDRDRFHDLKISVENETGTEFKIRYLAMVRQSKMKDFMTNYVKKSTDLSLDGISEALNTIIFEKMCDLGIVNEDQSYDMIFEHVGASADYGYICEIYIKIETPHKEDINISLPKAPEGMELYDGDKLPEEPSREIVKEKNSGWSLSDFFRRGKDK